jgi:hypothetical protein
MSVTFSVPSKSLLGVADYEVLQQEIALTITHIRDIHEKSNMLVIYALFAEVKSKACATSTSC